MPSEGRKYLLKEEVTKCGVIFELDFISRLMRIHVGGAPVKELIIMLDGPLNNIIWLLAPLDDKQASSGDVFTWNGEELKLWRLGLGSCYCCCWTCEGGRNNFIINLVVVFFLIFPLSDRDQLLPIDILDSVCFKGKYVELNIPPLSAGQPRDGSPINVVVVTKIKRDSFTLLCVHNVEYIVMDDLDSTPLFIFTTGTLSFFCRYVVLGRTSPCLFLADGLADSFGDGGGMFKAEPSGSVALERANTVVAAARLLLSLGLGLRLALLFFKRSHWFFCDCAH
jgi:hypothetical protein